MFAEDDGEAGGGVGRVVGEGFPGREEGVDAPGAVFTEGLRARFVGIGAESEDGVAFGLVFFGDADGERGAFGGERGLEEGGGTEAGGNLRGVEGFLNAGIFLEEGLPEWFGFEFVGGGVPRGSEGGAERPGSFRGGLDDPSVGAERWNESVHGDIVAGGAGKSKRKSHLRMQMALRFTPGVCVRAGSEEDGVARLKGFAFDEGGLVDFGDGDEVFDLADDDGADEFLAAVDDGFDAGGEDIDFAFVDDDEAVGFIDGEEGGGAAFPGFDGGAVWRAGLVPLGEVGEILLEFGDINFEDGDFFIAFEELSVQTFHLAFEAFFFHGEGIDLQAALAEILLHGDDTLAGLGEFLAGLGEFAFAGGEGFAGVGEFALGLDEFGEALVELCEALGGEAGEFREGAVQGGEFLRSGGLGNGEGGGFAFFGGFPFDFLAPAQVFGNLLGTVLEEEGACFDDFAVLKEDESEVGHDKAEDQIQNEECFDGFAHDGVSGGMDGGLEAVAEAELADGVGVIGEAGADMDAHLEGIGEVVDHAAEAEDGVFVGIDIGGVDEPAFGEEGEFFGDVPDDGGGEEELIVVVGIDAVAEVPDPGDEFVHVVAVADAGDEGGFAGAEAFVVVAGGGDDGEVGDKVGGAEEVFKGAELDGGLDVAEAGFAVAAGEIDIEERDQKFEGDVFGEAVADVRCGGGGIAVAEEGADFAVGDAGSDFDLFPVGEAVFAGENGPLGLGGHESRNHEGGQGRGEPFRMHHTQYLQTGSCRMGRQTL